MLLEVLLELRQHSASSRPGRAVQRTAFVPEETNSSAVDPGTKQTTCEIHEQTPWKKERSKTKFCQDSTYQVHSTHDVHFIVVPPKIKKWDLVCWSGPTHIMNTHVCVVCIIDGASAQKGTILRAKYCQSRVYVLYII